MTEAWLDRWQEGRTGWHQPDGNRSLHKYWDVAGRRVLVPLCGKTRDLLWLEQRGNAVTGVELSDVAVRAFFIENGIDFEVVPGDFERYVAADRDITIVRGDYFAFGGETFDACYDRGALAALSPDLRPQYAAHTASMLVAEPYMLLIVLEYDQSAAAGPPFSVPVSEVLKYWPALERVDAYDDLDNCPPKFRDAGLKHMLEVVWRTPATRARP